MKSKKRNQPSIVSDLQIRYERTGTATKIFKGLEAAMAGNPFDPIDTIQFVRKGIGYNAFLKLSTFIPFSMQQWSDILSISERTMQRYEKENKTFDPLQTEKIIQVALLYNKGIVVFGDISRLNIWLEAPNIALGGNKPKDLLDSNFGTQLVSDELDRIEHGIFA